MRDFVWIYTWLRFCRAVVNVKYFCPQIIWRLGTEVLQHHPHKDQEHFTVLYERMKNTGVKIFAKVCFHICVIIITYTKYTDLLK